ncbi:LCP family protein [Streptomyces sp. DT24]|uniref:LCP family protein n=1 Tax=Streptomyces sp. DT24 TaxID=3416520 RepID=UPI003CF9FEF5
MDADVTDSAGPPADPDHPATGKADGGADGEGTGRKGGRSRSADESRPEPEATPASEAGTETGAGTDAGTDADADTEAGAGTEAGTGTDTSADTGTETGTAGPATPVTHADQADPTDPTDPTGPSEPDEPTGPADPAGPAPKAKRHWLRWTALGASFVVLAAAGTGWWLYRKLDSNIKTDTGTAAELKVYEKERPKQVALDAENILLIGSDTRSGDNREYGRDDGGSQRSDTTILLHIAADRKSATAVSIPRDLMAHIPSCHIKDGKSTRQQFAQFNSAFEMGGTACTIRTIEGMTGIRIDHYMVVDFNGFKDMVNAVDGVDVCLKKPINDDDAHLKLPAGRQKLNGEQALGYVRARKSIGDGSDTERMDRQQQFLGALVNKMQSNGVLLNPTRLFPVLDAATKSLTTDPGLNTLKDLYDLVRGMRDVPTDKVQFLTVPRKPYTQDPNRDELVEPDAGRLFKQLREDAPVAVVPAEQFRKERDSRRDGDSKNPSGSGPEGGENGRKPGVTASGDPSPAPTYSGNNAATDLCKQ